MKKLTYKARKESDGGIFHIPNRKVMEEDLRRLPKGNYTLTIEKYRRNKSNPQLGYYFACVLPMFRQFALDAGWEFESLDEVDIYLKSLFADREIANKHSGEMIKIPALKRDMTTVDFMTYIDKVRDHCAEFLNGYIPDPESQLKMEL